MWGSKASTWSKKECRAGSMKWHLVDEDSLEERWIEVGWGEYKQSVKRTYGRLMCGGKKYPEDDDYPRYDDYPRWKLPLILKETVNMSQSNVCVYCKKFRMKELGISDKVIG